MGEDIKQYTLEEVIDEQVNDYILDRAESKLKRGLTPKSTILCGRCGCSMKYYDIITSRNIRNNTVKKHEHMYKCVNSSCGSDIDEKTYPPSAKIITQHKIIESEDKDGHETEGIGELIELIVQKGSGPKPAVASENDFKLE